jgi:hypothetical protein
LMQQCIWWFHPSGRAFACGWTTIHSPIQILV